MARERQLLLNLLDDPELPAVPALLSPDDLFERATSLVAKIHEDRRIERKAPGISPELVGCYLSCWSNTSPDGGLLVIGVEDKTGKILGCKSINPVRLNKLEKAGMDYCQEARYTTKRIPAKNDAGEDDFLLVYRVKYHPARVVETHDRRVFARWGDSCREIKTDEERQLLRIDKGEVQFEQEPANLTYPADFDMQAIRQFANKVREYRGLRQDATDQKVMELLHLGKKSDDEFHPNLAGALLFAKDPLPLIPGCKIRFLRFEGTTARTGDKWNAVKDEWIEGSIPNQINRAAELIDSQIRKFSGLGKDGKFSTSPEYPRLAWYEALVNACVHRSYNIRNMNVFVRMFDDRLEIESPGPFPPGITPQTIYDLQHSRNPFLMEAMHYLDFVKAANEGVKRIKETMLELGLPEPEFRQDEVGGIKVRVVLRNNIALRRLWVDSDVAAALGVTLTAQLDESEKLALNFVVVHGKINVSDVHRLTEHNWPTSKKLLVRLEAKGILERVSRGPADRKAHWVLRGASSSSGL